MEHEVESLVRYVEKERVDLEREPLKTKIKDYEFLHYFNYNLTTTTWNMLVNKQIYMTFERLFI